MDTTPLPHPKNCTDCGKDVVGCEPLLAWRGYDKVIYTGGAICQDCAAIRMKNHKLGELSQ